MRARSLILALGLFAAVASASDEFPMRWRVFCDYAAGVSFRYPYDYFIPDQYVGGLARQRGMGGGQTMIGREIEIDGKKVMVFEKPEKRGSDLDVRCLSSTAGALPSEIQGKSLAEIGDHFANEANLTGKPVTIAWQPFNYYATDGRPHGASTWATAGIEALRGEGEGVCGIVAKSGDRYSALVLSGGATEHANREILDSFEILATKGKETTTWRQGKVLTADGKLVKSDNGKTKPVSWAQGWELETKHYHVTTMVSPRRLLEYGAFLEALYKAYSEVYDPDQIPPYKMEIHVFNTWQDFANGAAANGIPVSSTTGGFFVPLLLSIFAFEETQAHFNSSTFTLDTVLAHECSHQFLHCTCNGSDHVPTWINEGLAVHFESGKFQGGVFHMMPPTERVMRLKAAYAQNKTTLMPLDQYLDHYGHIDALQYGEVYAMTDFWIFGSESGKKRFKQYWLALKAGENGTKAFERIFMDDLIKVHGDRATAVQVWQQSLLEYVAKKLK